MNALPTVHAPAPPLAWHVLWLGVTGAGAVAMTAFDAFLLQEKKAFFTGGFLAGTHTSSALEAAAFVALSLLADAALIGLFAAVALSLTARLRLTRAARAIAAVSAGLAPVAIADFVNYELLSYLGDAFDLSLMFDLTGRHPGEIVAVGSSHLASPMLLTVGAAAVAGAVVWTANRFGQRDARSQLPVARGLMIGCAALFGAGLGSTAIANATSDTFEDGLRRKPAGRALGWVVERLTDVDRDGFGLSGRSSDPDLFNAAVFPYAVDLPGNGVDENGVGGDLPSADPVYRELPAKAAAPWRRHPDVIMFVLESFRADALERQVGGKPVTPVLSALAQRGVAASMAFSHNGYTAQSRFHLMTGSLAGLRGGGSLVDDFNANGYDTAYFSAQDESFGGTALGVGFDRADVAYDARQDRGRRYSRFSTPGSLAVSHETLEERIRLFLAARTSRRPLFIYVNFHDTHYPYTHDAIRPLLSSARLRQGEIAPRRTDVLREMYFNTAANVDRAVGSTLEAVTRALGEPPAVIVTADHGESLFDEGFLGHGYALNDVQTRIPLVAAGLPLEIAEPFAQAELRDAINAALSKDPRDGQAPRLSTARGKRVFQYLGNIDRPRQIAFADGTSRLIYDFRSRRVHLPDGTRHRLEALDAAAASRAAELIHFWERMMLERARSASTQ